MKTSLGRLKIINRLSLMVSGCCFTSLLLFGFWCRCPSLVIVALIGFLLSCGLVMSVACDNQRRLEKVINGQLIEYFDSVVIPHLLYNVLDFIVEAKSGGVLFKRSVDDAFHSVVDFIPINSIYSFTRIDTCKVMLMTNASFNAKGTQYCLKFSSKRDTERFISYLIGQDIKLVIDVDDL